MNTCHCGEPVKAKQLCALHYQRQRRENPDVLARAARKQRAYMESPERKARQAAYVRLWARGWSEGKVSGARRVQGGLCAICQRAMVQGGRAHDSECADHYEDEGGKFSRALLCSTCNKGLGGYELRQRPAGLRIAPYEEYLARYDERYGSRTDNPG